MTLGERGPGCLPVTLGVSAHVGNTMFDQYAAGVAIPVNPDVLRTTWSLNGDFRAPLSDRMGVMAEYFMGQNLATFLGGIGQGIDPTTLNPIYSMGGWCEFWYDLAPWLHAHAGYGVDAPDNNDLATVGERSYNQVIWGNLVYDITKNWMTGIEVSSWHTNFVGLAPGESIRSEVMMKFGF